MKRFVITLVCLALTAGVLSGCGQTGTGGASTAGTTAVASVATTAAAVLEYMNVTGYPITKDKLVYKAMGQMNPVQGPWGETSVIKKMEQITNISFEWDTPLSNVYVEKKNLTLASGDFPDIFIGNALTMSDEETYGVQQKIFIPLEDLIEKYMPNLKKRMQENSNIKKAITATDGHIYALPYVVRTRTVAGNILYIDMDWLKNAGLQKPATVDELYTALKAFKESDPNKNGKPDEIPMSSVKGKDFYGNDSLMPIYDGTILNAFSGQAGGANFDIKDGRVIFNPVQASYKEYLSYMNKVYKEGLLDNEMFTQEPANMYAKGKEGRVGVMTASLSVMVNADKHNTYELLPPLTSSMNDKKVTTDWPGVITSCFAITNKCEYPEAIMRWVDMLYANTDENVEGICGLSMWIGIDNEDYTYTDSTMTRFTQKSKDPNLAPSAYIAKHVSPGAASGFPSWVVSDAVPDGNPLLLIKADESTKHYFPYMAPIYPNTVRLSEKDNQRATFLWNDINSYVNQMTAKFVIGEEPISNFDSFVNNLKAMSLDELTEIKQKAYEKWVSAE